MYVVQVQRFVRV